MTKILFFLFCAGVFVNLQPQCCTDGNNLLLNGNFENRNFSEQKPPIGFVTDNIWEPSIISPGYYIVLPFRNYGACFDSPQFDHTKGDSSGLFLWYDVDNVRTLSPQTPAIAYRPSLPNAFGSTTNSIKVKKNTYYIFSCWIRDIARETDCVSGGAPVMGLSINGQNLAEIDLGKFTSPCCPEWIQLCSEWYSGDSTEAYIQIESRSNSGFTDLGIDDVYFGESIPRVEIQSGFLRDTAICIGEQVELTVPKNAKKFSWEDGSKQRKRLVSNSGIYSLRITDSCNNSISDTARITVFQNAITPFSDTTICLNARLEFNRPSSVKQWTINGSNKTPFLTSGEKQLLFTYTDSNGCNFLDTTKIDYKNCSPSLRLCNVFTPGADGINDKWLIINSGYEKIQVKITNRWGEVVAKYVLPDDEHWNGRVFNKGAACPEGIYFYSVNAKLGESVKTIHGSLTMLRN